MTDFKERIHLVVLGAGVAGLHAAVDLLETGFKVTILADHFPGDSSFDYYSQWAGDVQWKPQWAFGPSFSESDNNDANGSASDPVSLRCLSSPLHSSSDMKSYCAWVRAAESFKGSEQRRAGCACLGCQRRTGCSCAGVRARIVPTKQYIAKPIPAPLSQSDQDRVPTFPPRPYIREYHEIPRNELPGAGAIVAGVRYLTVTLDVPSYLRDLMSRVSSLGGRFVRRHLGTQEQSKSESKSHLSPPLASSPSPEIAAILADADDAVEQIEKSQFLSSTRPVRLFVNALGGHHRFNFQESAACPEAETKAPTHPTVGEARMRHSEARPVHMVSFLAEGDVSERAVVDTDELSVFIQPYQKAGLESRDKLRSGIVLIRASIQPAPGSEYDRDSLFLRAGRVPEEPEEEETKVNKTRLLDRILQTVRLVCPNVGEVVSTPADGDDGYGNPVPNEHAAGHLPFPAASPTEADTAHVPISTLSSRSRTVCFSTCVAPEQGDSFEFSIYSSYAPSSLSQPLLSHTLSLNGDGGVSNLSEQEESCRPGPKLDLKSSADNTGKRVTAAPRPASHSLPLPHSGTLSVPPSSSFSSLSRLSVHPDHSDRSPYWLVITCSDYGALGFQRSIIAGETVLASIVKLCTQTTVPRLVMPTTTKGSATAGLGKHTVDAATGQPLTENEGEHAHETVVGDAETAAAEWLQRLKRQVGLPCPDGAFRPGGKGELPDGSVGGGAVAKAGADKPDGPRRAVVA